jgi:hypothetical protein
MSHGTRQNQTPRNLNPAAGRFVSDDPSLYQDPRKHAFRQNGRHAHGWCAACGRPRDAHVLANEDGRVIHVDTGLPYNHT